MKIENKSEEKGQIDIPEDRKIRYYYDLYLALAAVELAR
jgi:hypothetical protein